MSTRCLITFIPSKDSVVTFNPNHLPKKNPFEAFDGSEKEGLQNVLKNRRPVNFKAGVPHTTYCHWDGYVEGVGMTLLEHFSEEEKIANLVSVGACSSIYGSVTPYISRGEAFTAPRTDDPSKFAPFSDCDYIYRWSSDCGRSLKFLGLMSQKKQLLTLSLCPMPPIVYSQKTRKTTDL